jgi:hypothetical protein
MAYKHRTRAEAVGKPAADGNEDREHQQVRSCRCSDRRDLRGTTGQSAVKRGDDRAIQISMKNAPATRMAMMLID